ncbi:glycosyl transferase family 2 [Xylanimonas cellulosilytica DSM 15894]|uniref:Glycosyl transferase family 2 n=2 Tax=Xylanimonas TaxID=186188 RepID=D1BX29_XYLCX|nr:glycosyl transferase family 2 [Xylanimonas cellulosilytica DSM 15894]
MARPGEQATAAPFVSVVVPVFNDEDHIREALESCLAQSDPDLEIIVVDDHSTDMTAAIVDDLADQDERVSRISHGENKTAFQARRTGVLAARGQYLMFLDGDDTLAHNAVEVLRNRVSARPDMVHFGCTITGRDGREHPGFAAKLLPPAPSLKGGSILRELFLEAKTFEGQVWNKAYRAAYALPLFEALSPDARVPRANDLPVALMLAACAQTYIGIKDRLYNYRFGSGNATDGLISTDRFKTLVNFRPAFDVLQRQIGSWPIPPNATDEIITRLRSQCIERSVRHLSQVASPNGRELETLLTEWPAAPILAALYQTFGKREADFLQFVGDPLKCANKPTRDAEVVALYLDQKGIGGMQRVASLQAGLLARAGYRVVLLAKMKREEFPYPVPEGVPFVELTPRETSRTEEFLDLYGGIELAVKEYGVDTILLHANYRAELLYLILGLELLPLRSILTIHNFSLRSVFDRSPRFGTLRAAARHSDCLAVLSETDEVFWRLSGVETVRYVPNPVEFTLAHGSLDDRSANEAEVGANDAASEPCDVLWFGRIQERTKRVSEVVRIFALVAQERPGSKLHIVGPVPRTDRVSFRRLQELTRALGIEDAVTFLPPATDVDALIRSSSVVLMTSIIEGFPMGLFEPLLAERPVVMYDLPYLEVPKDNPGIFRVPWGDREKAASVILDLLEDDVRRTASARSGLAALKERFSERAVLAHLRGAIEVSRAQTVTAEGEWPGPEDRRHEAILFDQLFRLFHDSLGAGRSESQRNEVEAFYNTWHGSRTIRYSERLSVPIIAVRRITRRFRAAFRHTQV